MESKSAIVFVVEGNTDKESLKNALKKKLNFSRYYPVICGGDITSEVGSTPSNIKSKIVKKIKEELEREFIQVSDIRFIIQIVDTDGTFVEDECIKVISSCKNITCSENEIFTDSYEKVKKRNDNKARNIRALKQITELTLSKIKIKYRVFYFSQNLEHVLHNELNCSKEKKNELLDKWEDKCNTSEFDFDTFISDIPGFINHDYPESWSYIEKGNNSLRRCTNIHLMLKVIKDLETETTQ